MLKEIFAFSAMIFVLCACALDVPVTVREFHNIARTGEPVATGIPLPRGAYKNTRYFKIEGASNYQFHTLMVWPDSSIRWMLAQFNANVLAKGSAVYHVRDNSNGTLPASQLQVTEDASRVAVNTGAMTFKIKKTGGFNLFDEVTINGTQLVAPSDSNGARITAKYNNMLFRSAGNDTAYSVVYNSRNLYNGRTYSVEVLERGPVRTVIRVDGTHANGSDKFFYDYTAFIFAYAGKSYVRVRYVLGNSPYFVPRGPLKFKDLVLRTKVDLPGAKTLTLYDNQLRTAAMGASAYVFQSAKTTEATASFTSTLGSGSKALGWMDMSNNTHGVAVGIYQFWENNPKAVEFKDDGTVDAALFPGRQDTNYYLGDLMRKTSDVMFYFHEGSAASAGVEQVMNGTLDHYLVPTCDRSWYSKSRAIVGDVRENTTTVSTATLPVLNDKCSVTETVGWYNFGETFYMNDNNAREIYHPDGLVFLKSLNPIDFLNWEAHVRLDDLKPYHLHRDFDAYTFFSSRIDANGTSGISHKTYMDGPSAHRLGVTTSYDPLHWGSGIIGWSTINGWHTYKTGWIVQNWEHMDVKHILDWYCLTGDYRAKDMVREAGEYRAPISVWNYRYYGNPLGMARADASTNSLLLTYYALFRLPKLASFINEIVPALQSSLDGGLANNGIDIFLGTRTDQGVWMEGMLSFFISAYFYELTENPALLPLITRNANGWVTPLSSKSDNSLLNANGFVPAYLADAWTGTAATQTSSNWRVMGTMGLYQYASTVVQSLPDRLILSDNAKGFTGDAGIAATYCEKLAFYKQNTSEFRQNPMPTVMSGIYDTVAGSAIVKGPGEKNSLESMAVSPNPFNPAISIRLQMASGNPQTIKLAVYDLQGRKITDLSHTLKNGLAVWEAKDIASGIYLLKAEAGKKALVKKIVLQR